jgi:WSC domain
MTVEMYQAFCSSPTPYQMFGVEYAGECYCGNVLQAGSVGAPTTDCSMTCDGSPYEFCGAGNRLDVYQFGGSNPSSTSSSAASTTSSVIIATAATSVLSSSSTTTSPAATGIPFGWVYDGCYVDGVNGRILQHGPPDSQTNTVESCVNYCAGAGYTIAGMEFSTQCFCDNAIYNGGAPAANQADCNMACAGNPAEICGAGNRLSLYNIGNLTIYQAPKAQTTGIGN